MGERASSSGPFVEQISDVVFASAAIVANTCVDQAVTVPGALPGDGITIEPLGVWDAGLTIPAGRCLVAGTVQMRIGKIGAGDVTPASQTYRFFLNHARA